MRIKKGQGSLEYLFVMGFILVVVVVSINYLKSAPKGIPYNQKITLDPELFTNISASDGEVKVEAWLEKTGAGEYKVEYRVWTLKVPVKKVQLALICENKPPDVAGYKVITHPITEWGETSPLKPVNYWSNYWVPIPEKYFPCYIDFYIWKE